MTRLGKKQIEMLIMLGAPTMVLLTPGRSEHALVARGLLRSHKGTKGGEACCIAPAGLRALADAMEAGMVDDAIKRMQCEAKKRRARK